MVSQYNSQVSHEPLIDVGAVVLLLDFIVDTVSIAVVMLRQGCLQGLDELQVMSDDHHLEVGDALLDADQLGYLAAEGVDGVFV